MFQYGPEVNYSNADKTFTVDGMTLSEDQARCIVTAYISVKYGDACQNMTVFSGMIIASELQKDE